MSVDARHRPRGGALGHCHAVPAVAGTIAQEHYGVTQQLCKNPPSNGLGDFLSSLEIAAPGETMKIFVSWSGAAAKGVAIGLRTLLQDVNYKIQPWMSETDLEAGTRWAHELAEQLQDTSFGIICATRQSIESSWLHFEAGAVSKSTSTSRVCPYLIGLKPTLLTGPLSQFQSREATAEGTLSLLRSINGSMADNSLKEDQLQRNFNKFWLDLDAILRQVQATSVLSKGQKREFVKVLLSAFWRRGELEMLFMHNDLPGELVNWNQAMLYVCNDVLDAVEQEGKWAEFLQALERERPSRADVINFTATVRAQVADTGGRAASDE